MYEAGKVITNCVPRSDGGAQKQYRILGRLGEGGMATVYRAEELDGGRAVAIKFPDPDKIKGTDEEAARFFERFLREAQTAARIRHRNVIEIFDFGLDENDQPFIVMELIEGARTLELLIKERSDAFYKEHSGKIQGSLIPLDEALDYLCQLMAALAAIHAASVVHRDLKPANILIVTEQGAARLVVMDFGIAKDLKTDSSALQLTQDQTILGSPLYLSPEHILGKHFGPWSDIWSGVVILYEMISGQHPFFADSVQALIAQILTALPRPVTNFVENVNPGLLAFFEAGFSKDFSNRPQSASQVLQLVAGVQACQQISPPAASARRIPRGVWIGLVVAAVLAGLAVVGLTFGRELLSTPVAAGTAARGGSLGSASAPVPVRSATQVSTVAVQAKWPPGPGPTKDNDPKSFDALTRGLEAAKRGDCSAAELRLSPVAIKYSDYPPLLRALADCAWKKGNRTRARELYLQYLNYEGADKLPSEVMTFLQTK